jgi:hypothetical protein
MTTGRDSSVFLPLIDRYYYFPKRYRIINFFTIEDLGIVRVCPHIVDRCRLNRPHCLDSARRSTTVFGHTIKAPNGNEKKDVIYPRYSHKKVNVRKISFCVL